MTIGLFSDDADGPFTPKTPKASGYEREIAEFVKWVRGDSSAAPVTPESACDSVAIVDAERRSAKIGRAVRLHS